MIARRIFFVACSCLGLWLMAGCGAGDSAPLTAEMDDSYYREGQQFEREGRFAEALNAYLKAIDRRGASHSPESHLQIAIIYTKTQIKDPFEAVHYFKKYIDLTPPSLKSTLAREQMDAAKRDTLKDMPGRPFEDQAVQLNASEQIARLQRENNELRAELQAQRGNLSALPRNSAALANLPPPSPSASPSPFPTIGSSPAGGTPASSFAPAPSTSRGISIPGLGANAQKSTPLAPPPSGRRHKIKAGDNLSSIARQYYGNGSAASLNAIFKANAAVMKNINVLPRVGTELVIPNAP